MVLGHCSGSKWRDTRSTNVSISPPLRPISVQNAAFSASHVQCVVFVNSQSQGGYRAAMSDPLSENSPSTSSRRQTLSAGLLTSTASANIADGTSTQNNAPHIGGNLEI